MSGLPLAGGSGTGWSSRLDLRLFAAALVLVALVQSLALSWMVYDRVTLIRTGREIVLDTAPVDPRSLFRGDYVILNYDISRLDPAKLDGEDDFSPDSEIFVTLREEDGAWRAVALGTSYPKGTGGDVVLRGRTRYANDRVVNVRYGIEAYFVPEGEGKALEKLVRERKLQVLAAVGDDGEAAIKGLLADGRLQYEETLF